MVGDEFESSSPPVRRVPVDVFFGACGVPAATVAPGVDGELVAAGTGIVADAPDVRLV